MVNAVPSIAADTSGHTFVADQYNHRVQEFDSNGTFLMTWGSLGNGNGQFTAPGSITVDGSGHVFVVDGRQRRIQKFDNNGTFLTA